MWWWIPEALKGMGIGAVALTVGVSGEFGYETFIAKHPPKEYTIVIDPRFSTEQQSLLYEAMESWSREKRVAFYPEVGECPNTPDKVCILPVHQIEQCDTVKEAIGCTYSDNHIQKVDIDVECSTVATFSWLARHELGHVIGVPHDEKNPQSVMFPSHECVEKK